MMVTAGSTTLHIASCIVSPEMILGKGQGEDAGDFGRVLTHVLGINRGKLRALDKRSGASTGEHGVVSITIGEDSYDQAGRCHTVTYKMPMLIAITQPIFSLISKFRGRMIFQDMAANSRSMTPE